MLLASSTPLTWTLTLTPPLTSTATWTSDPPSTLHVDSGIAAPSRRALQSQPLDEDDRKSTSRSRSRSTVESTSYVAVHLDVRGSTPTSNRQRQPSLHPG